MTTITINDHEYHYGPCDRCHTVAITRLWKLTGPRWSSWLCLACASVQLWWFAKNNAERHAVHDGYIRAQIELSRGDAETRQLEAWLQQAFGRDTWEVPAS